MRSKCGLYKVRRPEVLQPLDKPFRYIPLTQGKIAIVDAKDFDWLNRWNWCATCIRYGQNAYAIRREGKQIIWMHRQILNCHPKAEVDHRNGNTLDNRRQNIRAATHSENAQNREKQRNNSSGFKGVSWFRRDHKWRARIHLNGEERHIGYFINLAEAAKAYDKEATELHGEFAHLNFPNK